MPNPFIQSEQPKGNPFIRETGKNPFMKEPAGWGESLGAIPEQFEGAMKQSTGGWLRKFGESAVEPAAPDDMPMHPVTGAPMPGSPWTGKRERESMQALGSAASKKGGELFAEGTEQIREATPENQTFWQEAVSTATQSLGQSAPLAVGAFITRRPSLVAAGFGLQEYGRAYGEAREQGLSPAEATRHATISGMIEGGTEFIPGKQLFKKGSKPFKRLVNFMAAELPGENVAEIGQMVNDYVSGLREDVTGQDVLDTMKMTSAATLLSGGAQTGAAHTLISATEKMAEKKKERQKKKPIEDVVQDKQAETKELSEKERLALHEKKAETPVADMSKEDKADALSRLRAERKGDVPLDEVTPEKKVDQMTEEELRTALLTHDLTGLPNRRAYIEASKKPGRVSADVDSLKYINDEFGHDAGNELLKAVAGQMQGLDAFHISGDEFIVQADTQEQANQAMQELQDRLKSATLEIETPDGRVFEYEPGLSYGTAATLSEAEQRLQQQKQARERSGERAGRGERPPQLREVERADRGRGVQPERGQDQGQATGQYGDTRLEENLAQQGQTRLEEQARASGIAPAGQELINELDDPTESELQERVDQGEITPEQIQRAQAAREVLAERPDEKYAANVNLERIKSTKDLDNAFQAIASTFADPGEVSHEQLQREAEALGLREEDLRRWDRKDGLTREKMLAARRVLVESGDDLVAKAKKAKGGDAQSLMEFKGALERHNALMAKVSGMTREAGRILNQFNITAEAAQGSLKAIENIMEQSGDKLKRTADMMSSLDDPAARNKFAQDAYRAKTSDVLIEAWINALLSGPATHVVNMTSNTLVSWVTSAEHFLAAGISKVTGGNITFKEARANLTGWAQGALEGMQAAGKAFATEQPTEAATKLEQRRHKSISAEALGLSGAAGRTVDLVGQGVRIPGRFLMAEDEFFRSIGFRQSLNSLATRRAINEGHRGDKLAQRVKELTKNPSEDLIERARERGAYQTFTKPLGPSGRKFQQIANELPALKLLVPFIRTPTNIVKFAGERSPLAPLSKNVRDSLKGKGKVEREVALARVMAGSAIWAGAAYYASMGLITGGGPDEPEQKAALYRNGWQPYSIKIGGEYYSYARLEPLGMLLGTASDAVEIWDAATEAERDEMASLIVVSALGSIGDNLLSKTWLQGLSDAFQAINDPERYGKNWIQRFSGTVVPTASAQVARTKDPYLRRVETITDSIKSRVPGQREELLPRLNLWGEPIKLGGGLGPDFVSPVYMSTDKQSPVEQEMQRLEIFPRMPQAKINKVELTPKQHNEFIRLAGQPAKQMISQLIQMPEYQAGNNYYRKQLIDKALDKTRDMARVQMIRRYPEILQESAQKKVEAITQ